MTNQKLYYHKLNTSQSEDVAVVVFDNPEYVIGAKVSHCGNYLIVEPCRGCKTNLLYYVQLPKDINGKSPSTSINKLLNNHFRNAQFNTIGD